MSFFGKLIRGDRQDKEPPPPQQDDFPSYEYRKPSNEIHAVEPDDRDGFEKWRQDAQGRWWYRRKRTEAKADVQS
ncbi:hypothetical protein Mal15_38140 [Stieleria maiorica]|uniref:Uncharacterized protein n=1 Tax=Stieleria maiorica TaxID=2795974 RepID=A0A5B9MF63_9BACT|nr:hypothetical protein [Stieleria maiorica]QEF99748.1 hypothetical protein Mal15_38140 [Stieleria maiorica]